MYNTVQIVLVIWDTEWLTRDILYQIDIKSFKHRWVYYVLSCNFVQVVYKNVKYR